MSDSTCARERRVAHWFRRIAVAEGTELQAAWAELRDEDDSLEGDVQSLLGFDAAEGDTSSVTPLEELRRASTVEDVTDAEMPLPKSVGPFQLTRRLRELSAGTVCEAVNEEGRAVSLILIRSELFSARALCRLSTRVDALKPFDHPGLARVDEAGMHRDDRSGFSVPYVVMERIGGVPLGDALNDEAAGRQRRLECAALVAEALGAAHQLGVVHHDLEPAHVLRRGDGPPKVLGFAWGERQSPPPASPYRSPEERDGGLRGDARADVYSLGVMLSEWLTGCPYDRATRDESSSIRRREAALDPALRRVIHCATATDPTDRYRDGHAFANDLRRLLRGESVEAREPISATRPRPHALRGVRDGGVLVGVAGLVVAVAALLLFAVMKAGSERVAHAECQRLEGALREALEQAHRAERDAERLTEELRSLRASLTEAAR